MSRTFSKKEFNERRMLDNKGHIPDIVITFMHNVNRPVIKVLFFRSDDSIQNE